MKYNGKKVISGYSAGASFHVLLQKQVPVKAPELGNTDLVIAFGSCNNQRLDNPLWEAVLANRPDLFLWDGDIVYSDTENMDLMRSSYERQKRDPKYRDFREKVPVDGTWDDHDYGNKMEAGNIQKKTAFNRSFWIF